MRVLSIFLRMKEMQILGYNIVFLLNLLAESNSNH